MSCGLVTSAAAFETRMTFENGKPGNNVQSAGCSLYGEPVFTGAAGKTLYNSDESFTGSQSAEVNTTAGEQGFGNFGGIIEFESCSKYGGRRLVKGDEIWVRLRIKFPIGWEYDPTGLNKFLRFRVFHDDPAPISEGYNDLYIDGNIGRFATPFVYIFEGEGGQEWFPIGVADDLFTLGKWHTVEFYLFLDNIKGTSTGNSMVRFWMDGILLGETNDRNTLGQADSYIDRFQLFTWWSNDGAEKSQKVFIDDLVITTEIPPNRDLLGNPMIGTNDPPAPSPPSDLTVP